MRKFLFLSLLLIAFTAVPLTADCFAGPITTFVSPDLAMKVVKIAAAKWKISCDTLWAEYQAGGCIVTEIDPKAGIYQVESITGGSTIVLLESIL